MNENVRVVPASGTRSGLAAIAVLCAALLGVSAQAQITFSGPITITQGGVYSGNWQSLNPDKPAVTIDTSEAVVIENSNIQSRGALIRSRYVKANLTVRNSRGVALNPGLAASYRRTPGYFVHLEEFQNVRIENNELIGTSGIYLNKYLGDPNKGHTIKVMRNKALNIDGRYSDGPNAFSETGFYRVQFVQFNDVKNIPNAEIAWNQIVNEPGKSRVEENINMYVSSGTPNSPVLIHDNYIQGAYPTNPATDKYGGGGIMLGDGQSSSVTKASAYLRAYNNQIVSTSNQGIAIAAGHNNEAYNNRVISSGLLPDGRRIASQNVGIYVWDLHGDKARSTFFNNVMYGNVVGWAQPVKSATAQNPFWFPNCDAEARSNKSCKNNTALPGTITRAMEAQEFERWQAKLRASNVVIGPRQ
ncbi:hypothetical protein E7T06_20230 [Deinococcus sp. Arct2-2]|uniref:hypothetical protein n=1 Tax=Deinococcus sp. Arct2-2 TaxID=2568653 RepID=UPI0010A54B22|nr:hypothetical protein [Deinococcus sp. Arct2-2]THF67629.1 hypothetical protein E7T06_20230 [Deinococcus sp. Arct2-2]